MKQSDHSSELPNFIPGNQVHSLWLTLLGEQYFYKTSNKEQINFLKALEKKILDIAVEYDKAPSDFLIECTLDFRNNFPKLPSTHLDQLISYIDGMIICLHFYKLLSFSALEQHLLQQKNKAKRKIFNPKTKRSNTVSPFESSRPFFYYGAQ